MVGALQLPLLLSLDATGTLFQPRYSPGKVYRDHLVRARSLHDSKSLNGLPSQQQLDLAFQQAYRAKVKAMPSFGSGVCTSKEWWRDVVKDAYLHCSITVEELDRLSPTFFEDLYIYFQGTDAWTLKPHAEEVIRFYAQGGVTLAVISNWDERLHALLRNFGLHHYFEAVITSREVSFIHAETHDCTSAMMLNSFLHLPQVGKEKPNFEIFEAARFATGALDARAIHVGDSFENDVNGALGANFEAVYVGNPDDLPCDMRHCCTCISGLCHLPSVLRLDT